MTGVGARRRGLRDWWLWGNAAAATGAAATLVAIRWLALFGVVRIYDVPGSGNALRGGVLVSAYWSSASHQELGVRDAGPSVALTHLDRVAWTVAVVAGLFWVLRLALGIARYRIGALRGFGVVMGFGLFVATGALHRASVVVEDERHRRWVDGLITLWCTVTALSAIVLTIMTHQEGAELSAPRAVALRSTLPYFALQLLIIVGGWLIAAGLTREAVRRTRFWDLERDFVMK